MNTNGFYYDLDGNSHANLTIKGYSIKLNAGQAAGKLLTVDNNYNLVNHNFESQIEFTAAQDIAANTCVGFNNQYPPINTGYTNLKGISKVAVSNGAIGILDCYGIVSIICNDSSVVAGDLLSADGNGGAKIQGTNNPFGIALEAYQGANTTIKVKLIG